MLSKTKVTGEKMTNERIKEILLDIEETGIDFSVIQTGKESKRVNGFINLILTKSICII